MIIAARQITKYEDCMQKIGVSLSAMSDKGQNITNLQFMQIIFDMI